MQADQAKIHGIGHRAGALLKERRARQVFANNLLKELSYAHGLLKNLGRPRIYQLETTNCCPYTCNMCPRTHAMTREQGHMDIGLFRAILDQVEPFWQVDDLVEEPYIALWHFGEPMVYKHFVEAVAYCHERGIRASISTNPSAWTARRIDEILEVGVDELYVMFDGMDDETSMSIRGRAASFVRGEANFRRLLERKAQLGVGRPRLHVSMIKQQRNAHQWETFKSHWKQVEGIDSVLLCDLSTFAGDVPELITISNGLAAQDTAQAIALKRDNGLSRFPCYYPWHSVTVTWDGRVVPCCRDHNGAAVLGDLTKETLEAVWNGEPMQALRKEFVSKRVTSKPCDTCREKSNEIGLPGRYYPISRINLERAWAKIGKASFP